MDIGENFKNSWDESRSEPFIPHAELMSFDEFVERIGIPEEQAFQTLKAAAITVNDRKRIIKDIAEANDVAPSEIHDLLIEFLSKEEKDELAQTAKPQSRGGFGAMSLEQVAGELGMSVEDAIAILGSKGIASKKSDLIKTIATNNGKRPFEIVNLLRDAKK